MSEQRADPWGWHEPPLVPETDLPPLSPRLADLADLAGSGQPREMGRDERWERPAFTELTEMAGLLLAGWRPLDADPQLELLPAVWPAAHRGWLPDRLPGIGTRLEMPSRRRWLVPHPPGRDAEVLAGLNENARRAGLPAAPPGRQWLLRSPWPDLGMSLVLTVFRLLRDVRDERDDHDVDAAPGNAVAAAHELLGLDEAGVLSHLLKSQRAAVEGWRREGRTGEEVAAFAQAGLHPHHARRLTAPIAEGVQGSTLTRAQAGSGPSRGRWTTTRMPRSSGSSPGGRSVSLLRMPRDLTSSSTGWTRPTPADGSRPATRSARSIAGSASTSTSPWRGVGPVSTRSLREPWSTLTPS